MKRVAAVLFAGALLAACTLPAIPAPPQPTATPPLPTSRPAASQPTSPPTAEAAAPQATAPPPPAPPAARYEPAECRFDVPAGVEVSCGYLTVPERRDRPTDRTIRLHVAVFKSSAAQPAPDPVIYLDGGPGGETLEITPFVFGSRYIPILMERDLIVYDQRGVGFSEPSLDCPELTELEYELLDDDLPTEEANRRYFAVAAACRDRLAGEGIDLSAYNSIESAADLRDLRLALGYESWNLYGISYGTRLALTTMREHPEGIRSVVIDSVLPTSIDLTSLPAAADRGFRTLFEGCAAEPACSRAYPDLAGILDQLLDELSERPRLVRAVNPLTGEMTDILLNDQTVINTIFDALYSTSIIPTIPQMIAEARSGNDDLLAQQAIFAATTGEFLSEGMYYSVTCNEELSFNTPDELAAADDAYPRLRGTFDIAPYGELCSGWGAGTAPAVENEPVTSDIPTLVLTGEYDPITPPEYGRIAAETLTNSFLYEFPGLGHGVSADDGCAMSVMLQFLDEPTREPDASCITEMGGPRFITRGGR